MNSIPLNLRPSFITALVISFTVITLVIKFAPTNKLSVPSRSPVTGSQPSLEATPTAYKTQSEEEASVTVSVKPLVLAHGKQPKFQVSFDTHSVNLDFDVTSIAVLTNSFGVLLGPAVWEGTPTGGHHRNGTLTFQNPLDDSVQGVSLTFKDIAGVPVRTFFWTR